MLKKSKELNISLIFILTIITNILIPKAGIKMAGIPLTIGSLLFFFLIIKDVLINLRKKNLKISKFSLTIILSIFYWVVVVIYGILKNNFPSTSNTLYTNARIFSYFISLCICPIIFLSVQKNIKNRKQLEYVINIIYICVLIVLIYACLQYFVGIGTVQIPGITVNFSDYLVAPSGWWRKKANAVSVDNSKIISTYQNGNLFGANMLLLFPIVNAIPYKNKFLQYIGLGMFCFCSLVSGSRAFLFAMCFYAFILLIQSLKEGKISKKSFIYGILFILIAITLLYRIINIGNDYVQRVVEVMNWDSLSNASNRVPKIQEYIIWLFSSKKSFLHFFIGSFGMNHSGEAYEMLWAGIFIFGGIIGVFIFYIPFIRIMNMMNYLKKTDVIGKGIFNGVLVYLFVSMVEGAFWLLPTAINVWIVIGFGYKLIELKYKKEYIMG